MYATIYWNLWMLNWHVWVISDFDLMAFLLFVSIWLTCCKSGGSPISAFKIACAISVCSSLIFCIISLISYRSMPRKHNFKNAITQYPITKRMSAVCLIQTIKTSIQPCWVMNEKKRSKKIGYKTAISGFYDIRREFLLDHEWKNCSVQNHWQTDS